MFEYDLESVFSGDETVEGGLVLMGEVLEVLELVSKRIHGLFEVRNVYMEASQVFTYHPPKIHKGMSLYSITKIKGKVVRLDKLKGRGRQK